MSDFTSTSQQLFAHVRVPTSSVILRAARKDAEVEKWLRVAAWARAGVGAAFALLLVVIALTGTGTATNAIAATAEPAIHSPGYLPAQFTNVPYVDAAPIDTF
jgi:hypothetical protein